MIEVSFLGSGSTGNCAVVRSGRTAVLLDAGLSVRDTSRRLASVGMTLAEVSGLLLTHEHSDHVRAAADLARKAELPVWGTAGTLASARLPGPLFADLRPLAGGDELRLGDDLFVRAVTTPHDGCEPVCYVFNDGRGRRVGIATDLGHLSTGVVEALSGCEVLGLEANHDVDLLRDGPYPVFLKRRILSGVGHLSNEAAADGMAALVGERTRAVVLLHVSLQNNTPALALSAVTGRLSALGAGLVPDVAPHDRPTGWVSASDPAPVATEAKEFR